MFDVIVIGSGGAGCSAALIAERAGASVLMLTRAEFLDSKTNWAQGGIQAPLTEDDSPDKLYEDTLAAGEYANEPALTRKLADDATTTVQWLMDIGIEFDRSEDGDLLTRGAAGISVPRVLSCGDASGNRIMAPLQRAIDASRVDVETFRTVVDIKREGEELIVTGFDPRDQSEFQRRASCIVMATGGAVPREKRAGIGFVGDRPPPDTIALAAQIGLEVESPELTQFHPTGIVWPKELRRKPVPEMVRAQGATLSNKHGAPFADEMLTRKKLCDAIVEECEKGNGVYTDDGRVGVWLNTQEVDEKQGAGYTAEHFATLHSKMLDLGQDITKQPVLVYPIAHYTIGGVRIGPNCETNIKGIFAAGEATWGVHGVDRLMGNSLLEVFVFGRAAGKAAAEYVQARKAGT